MKKRIIGSLLTITVGVITNWLSSGWLIKSIGGLLAFLMLFMTNPVTLQLWILMAIAFAYSASKYVTNRLFFKEPRFYSYVSDSFLGMNWSWKYCGRSIDEDTIMARCPLCNHLLFSSYGSVKDVIIHERGAAATICCPHCSFRTRMDDANLQNDDDFIRFVYGEIDRKIVSGNYAVTK